MENGILRRRSLFAGLAALSVIALSGCFGADGAVLWNYWEPENLKLITDDPTGETWLAHEDIWILDVRESSEYTSGHIPTALSFPSSEIMSRLDELPWDQYLILYCETGGRAMAVAGQLDDVGYTRWMNWGGIIRWPYRPLE